MGRKTNEENLKKILQSLVQSSEDMKKTLSRIEEKLDQILVPSRTLMLPDHLKPTMMALQQLGEATAGQVAEKTGITRATTSDYLNQIVRMGYLKKRKVGKVAYFSQT